MVDVPAQFELRLLRPHHVTQALADLDQRLEPEPVPGEDFGKLGKDPPQADKSPVGRHVAGAALLGQPVDALQADPRALDIDVAPLAALDADFAEASSRIAAQG